jgi:hypothetical protein
MVFTATDARVLTHQRKNYYDRLNEKYFHVFTFLKSMALQGQYVACISHDTERELREIISKNGFCVRDNVVWWGNTINGYNTTRRGDAKTLLDISVRVNKLNRAISEIKKACNEGASCVTFVTNDPLLIKQLQELGYSYAGDTIRWL